MYKRYPCYGIEIDKKLAEKVLEYNNFGVPVTNLILKCLLQTLLETNGREDILNRICPADAIITKQQDLKFGNRWANRFYTRHDFTSRVATTKMREDIPQRYEEKKEEFVRSMSYIIRKFNIPDELIVGCDETNTQFTPSIKKTRCRKGTKRVRIVGIGHEKPQITVTICCSAAGDIVEPTQLIFGGKTKRCHPNQGKTAPPLGLYYDESSTHWQTPKTMVTYITKVLVL